MTDAPSPFDRLRTRWLVVQFALLLGAAAWLYDRMQGPRPSGGDHAGSDRLGMVLTYGLLGLVLLVRGSVARLNWRALFGERPSRGDLVLLGVIVPVDVLTLGLHRWARRCGTVRAVIASSVLFAVLHGEWVGHFLFGVARCALYLRTRTLWAPMLAHASSNLVVALVLGSVLLWWYLQRFWPAGRMRAVLTGPMPYDVYAASATPPDSTSAS